MKKILFALLICLSLAIVTTPSMAAKCEGGEEIQGVINKHIYCRSKNGMTWWGAMAWCKKQGRELASIKQLCIEWAGSIGVGICPNMQVSNSAVLWSSNPMGNYSAYTVDVPDGSIGNLSRYTGYGNKGCAVCY